METSIWLDLAKIVAGILTGGGLWAVIKARVDKRKTPYDMLRDLLAEQKKFYEERNADYEREKLDSAEKSAVIMETRQCAHRFEKPSIVCPVDEANARRLAERCKRIGYCPLEHKDKEDEQ